MMRPVLGALLTSSVLAFAFLGCNSILDNNAGTLVVADEAGALPGPGANPTPTQPPGVDGPDAGTTPPPDAGEMGSPGCPAGQQTCLGTCISLTDPLYGCGNPACTPCPSGHGTMGCQGRTCIVTGCDKGYADCNAKAVDGCETDLSKATSCGACNATCGAAAPQCSPSGPTFQCTSGCTPASPLLCGAECVDPNTSTNHCGSCITACPAVTNGTAACAAATCSFTCNAGFHACAGKCPAQTDPAFCGPTCTACPVPAGGVATCVADTCGIQCTAPNHACGGKCVAATDPTACGAACTVCPIPASSTASCTGGACAFACSAGFADCDEVASTGCEINTMTDAANCGICGKACVAPQTCVTGACQ